MSSNAIALLPGAAPDSGWKAFYINQKTHLNMQIWKKSPPGPTIVKSITRRRDFLKFSGATLATGALLMAGCDLDDDTPIVDDRVDLGSGDLGVLNYAYALEQIEATFYAAVLQGGYYQGAPAEEKQILADLEKHERAHVEFFQAAISSVGTAIPGLVLDFSSVDFNDRDSVLGTAKVFEDLGVSAYNGAGRLIMNPQYLLVAGKIVSVEARHAAAIRSIYDSDPKSFAGDDVVDANGLDRAMTPAEVLAAAAPFVVTEIDASNLPA